MNDDLEAGGSLSDALRRAVAARAEAEQAQREHTELEAKVEESKRRRRKTWDASNLAESQLVALIARSAIATIPADRGGS